MASDGLVTHAFRFHPTIHLTMDDILHGSLQPSDWTWASKKQLPILGSLRSTVGSRRHHTYTHDRDNYRARRSAPPIWSHSSARFAATLWRLPRPGLQTRALACRTLWDHRWHGENQSIAATGYNLDVPLTRCPLCGGYWSQHHVIRKCKALNSLRTAAELDLALAIGRLIGPSRLLADSYTTLLLPSSSWEPSSTAQLWTGLWPPAHRALLRPALAACSLRDASRSPTASVHGSLSTPWSRTSSPTHPPAPNRTPTQTPSASATHLTPHLRRTRACTRPLTRLTGTLA